MGIHQHLIFNNIRHQHRCSQNNIFYLVKGGVDLITRIPWGIVADHKSVNRHYLMSFVCLNMAVAIYCFTLSNTYIHLIGSGLN